MTGLTDPAALIAPAVRPVLTALAQGTPGVNAADVDDLASEVMAKVLARIQAGAEIRDVGLYAKQAARYAFYDHVERRGRLGLLEPKRPSGDEGPAGVWLDRVAPPNASNSPSAQLIASEDRLRHREAIAWALEQLKPVERSVLVLRHRDGLTGHEIAELLGYKSAATVDTTAARARAKLITFLSPSLAGWVRGR